MSDRELLQAFRRNVDAFEHKTEAFLSRLDATATRVHDQLDENATFVGDAARILDTAMKRSDALTEHLVERLELMSGRLDALTEAIMRLLERLDGGPAAA